MSTRELQVGLLALCTVLVSSVACVAQAPRLRIKIDSGPIAGAMQGPVRAFLGIPYAAPPVGDLRWKPPAPPVNWSATRQSTQFGARCMQGQVFGDMSFRDAGESEDCLTLNVWTPSPSGRAKLPVMVWIHGGGYRAGGTSEPRQDGQFLARLGVVVVSMNYRLGAFGFLALPELAAESGRNTAGNYGLLDQIAALRWVQRNIARFGGDPRNVTIFGESAGSFSVSTLMASPAAHGLFHKAIGESGAAFSDKLVRPLAEREESDSKFVQAWLGTTDLKELRAVPARKILEEFSKHQEDIPHLGAVIDGYVLPQSLPAIFAAGKQNDVPLLAGWNRDEGGPPDAANAGSAEKFSAEAKKQFAGRAAEFLRLYPADSDASAAISLAAFRGDEFIAWSTWSWLEAAIRTGKRPVYRYRFDRSLPSATQKAGLGAYHSAEIEYVFGTLDSKPGIPWQPEDRALSQLMQTYWVNFASKGDPNGAGLPAWPQYTPGGQWPVMHLAAESHAMSDDQRPRYLFLSSAWAQ